MERRVTESFGESMKLDVNKVHMAADLVRVMTLAAELLSIIWSQFRNFGRPEIMVLVIQMRGGGSLCVICIKMNRDED